MSYFGTDGIRKKASEFTPEFLRAVAKGLANYGESLKPEGGIKVLIGGDTRESSEAMIRDFEEAFESLGVEYGSVGVLSTPAISYVFYEMGFDFAIDITASHNPWTDNGIKIFERGSKGSIKLSDAGREFIEKAIEAGQDYPVVATELRENLHDEAVEIYLEHLRSFVGDASFAGMKIGLDCANGATSVVNKRIFEEFGAEVMLINCNENYGQVINKDCGSTHIEALQKIVVENHLDFGAAFDGDGDRVLMVDKNGDAVDGDQMIVILAESMGLKSAAVTVMANQGIFDWAKRTGVSLEVTPVGDENVAEAMRTKGIMIGGEQSGHVILPNEATGDGMATALVIAAVIAKNGKSLDELASSMTRFPQITVNIRATEKQKAMLKTSNKIKSLLLEYDQKIAANNGKLLVRPSGTESLVRITVWGKDEAKITTLADELAKKIDEYLS